MAGAIRNFGLCLLYTVFTKKSKPAIGRLANDIGGKLFANRQQLHFRGCPPGPVAGGSDSLLHRFQVGGDVDHGWSLANGSKGE